MNPMLPALTAAALTLACADAGAKPNRHCVVALEAHELLAHQRIQQSPPRPCVLAVAYTRRSRGGFDRLVVGASDARLNDGPARRRAA